MKVKQNFRRLLLMTIVCFSFGYFSPNVNAQQTPSYDGTGVFGKPVAVKFTGLGSTVAVGDVITPDVEVASNGLTITDYQWFLGDDNIGSGQTLTPSYTVKATDHNKVLKVKVIYSTGSVEIPYQDIQLGGEFLAEKNTVNFPSATILNNNEFAVTIGKSFTLPTIDYTNNGMNAYYYVLAPGSTTYSSGTTQNITISYLGEEFQNCQVVESTQFQSILGTDRTIFLEDGTFEITAVGQATFYHTNLNIIGASSDRQSVIKFIQNGTSTLRNDFGRTMVYENLIFDGNNIPLNQYFISFNVEANADGFVMKKVNFRNIGNAKSNCKSLFNFYEAEANRNYNVKRYFIDVVLESGKFYVFGSAYDLININGGDGIYFHNLEIKGYTGGSNYPITVCNGTASTMGSQNIIFRGDLKLPTGKKIRILRHTSRGISLPEEYHYMQFRTSWSPTGTSVASSAIEVYRETDIPTSVPSSGVIFDAKINKYLVFAKWDVSAQLSRIQTLIGQSTIKAACTLPALNIKLIAKDDGSIPTFTIPAFTPDGGTTYENVNIAAFKNLSNDWSQVAKTYMANFGGKITINQTNANKVKLYNIDFSNQDLSTIYHATGIEYLPTSTQSTIDTPNSFYDSNSLTSSSFHNCLFKNFAGTPISINGDVVISLGNTTICDSDPSAALPITITGTDNDKDWNISYQVKGDGSTLASQSVTGPTGAITLANPPTLTTTYELTKAEGPGPKDAFVTGTGIATVTATPVVDPISGASSVTTGSTTTLSSTTVGGSWSSSNAGVATVDPVTGVVTGVSSGSTQIIYAVTDNGCVGEAIHNLTVSGTTTPPVPPVKPEDPDPGPDPDPDGPGLALGEIAPFCFEEREFRIPYKLTSQKAGSTIEYTIRFSDEAKAAGLKDMIGYKELTSDYITVQVSNRVEKGIYKGTVYARFVGAEAIVNSFEFTLEILEYVQIAKQPVSTYSCGNDPFFLDVEVTGQNLSYQWFYNGEKILGATSSTYTKTISLETEGDYYVEVYGLCGMEVSDTVTVKMSALSILMKWDDVLYVKNTDNRYIKFQWYKDGQEITTHGQSIYYTDPQGLLGTYFVRAYYSNDEYDQSCPITLTTKTRSSVFAVYPNPVASNTILTIKSNEMGESYIGGRAELYNMSGVRLFTTDIYSATTQIPMSFQAGYYILRIIHTSGKTTVEKVIVK